MNRLAVPIPFSVLCIFESLFAAAAAASFEMSCEFYKNVYRHHNCYENQVILKLKLNEQMNARCQGALLFSVVCFSYKLR